MDFPSLFTRAVVNLCYLLVVFAIAPMFLSASNTLLVIVGFFMIITIPLVLYYGNRKFVNLVITKFKENL